MATSLCLTPNNINPLSPNGFNFSISKLPDVAFFCQRVLIPSVTLASIENATPFVNNSIPGEILTYSELTVSFLVDDQMKNYKSIYNWMVALGFPDNYDQYKSFIGSNTTVFSELAKNYSDGTVTVLDGSNNPTNAFKFYDMYPVSLDPVQFESTAMDVNYVIGSATFKYTYFTIDHS